ncbi:ABC transporter ATP-binding protein [Agarivorans albus]
MATLDIKQLYKRYGKNGPNTLEDINISIESGEFLILVGPSGCGKSTLMNMIAGLEEITAGDICIDSKVVNDVDPKDRDIAMVFQSYALYPNMTVRGNIEFALKIQKMDKPERDKEITRVAQLLQIEHLLDRKPSQLSGGQQQRVSMGRALARQPKIYLFDEPLSNLDAKLRVEMRHEIKKLHQRLGTTIVYVTHDQIEAMTLADRIAVMKDGQLLQLGSPAEIYNDPADMFVAGFMGSPAMNFLHCSVEQSEQGLVGSLVCDQQQSHTIPLPDHLAKYAGKSVVVGIRPEQITHVNPYKKDKALVTTLNLKLGVLEPTGPDTIALVSLNDKEISCRLDPDKPAVMGENLDLMFDMSSAVFFDPNNEQRIR